MHKNRNVSFGNNRFLSDNGDLAENKGVEEKGEEEDRCKKPPFLPPVGRRGQGFWTPACLLFGCLHLRRAFLHLAPGCVLEPMWGTGQRKSHFPSAFSLIHYWLSSAFCNKEDEDKRRWGCNCFSLICNCSFCFFFLHFPLTSIFHDLVRLAVPLRFSLYRIHLVPIHTQDNLSITGERGKLIIYWWNGATMNS